MSFTTTLTRILEQYEGQELNPELWDKNGQIIPEIRNKLYIIATDFAKQHVIPSEAIEDITITGSMANYNWSKHSDIDLHLVVNYDLIDENDELLDDYYRLAKSMWNSTHDIQICGHEVEVYIQDSREPHHSSGIYSLGSGEWIVEPTPSDSVKPDTSSVQQKAEDFIERIDQVERKVEGGQGGAFEEAEKIRLRIKSMRQAGLESAGEFSVENLAFKYLRNNGHLDRLSRLRRVAYDDQFTKTDCEAEPPDGQGKDIGEDVNMKLHALRQSDTLDLRVGDTIVADDKWDKRLRALKKRRDPDNISTQPIDVALREADEVDPYGDTDPMAPDKQNDQNRKISGKEIVDAHKTLEDLRKQYRAGKDPNQPLDFEGRLELALRDSERASQTASFAAREVNQLRHDMQRGFGDIMTRLDQIASGSPPPEPDPPGSSIWDDDFEDEL